MAEQHVTNRASNDEGVSHAWRALRHRNFRLFLSGQSVSLVGTWMTRLATSWLVYRLTKSALLLGYVAFAGQLLAVLLAPFAGVWVERLDRRKLLVWTQALSAGQSLALAALTLSGHITIWEIIALTMLQGGIDAFDMPARQSFMVQMVGDRTDLSNAIALNSSMVNATRLVGPALAGLIIAWVGEGWCFLLDGVSYFAVIGTLLAMRLNVAAPVRRAGETMLGQMREGFSFVRGYLPIRTVLVLFSILSLMYWPYAVLLPIFAGQVLHGGAHTLGFLTGAGGLGALSAALVLATQRSAAGLTKGNLLAGILQGVGLIGFGLSHSLPLSMVMMVIVGYGMMTGLAGSNTLLQTLVPEDKRGRVMSYYTMSFIGTAPLGSLLAGWLAHAIGASWTVAATGACALLAAAWYATVLPRMDEMVRPVFAKMDAVRSTNEPAEEARAGAVS